MEPMLDLLYGSMQDTCALAKDDIALRSCSVASEFC